MNIVVGIPSGQRAKQLIKVVKAWHDRGIDCFVLTWDEDTAIDVNNEARPKYFTLEKERYSFGVNQNLMMKAANEWDIWICGADDLWPGRQPDLKERIELVAQNSGDKLIWVMDGCFNAQPTHAVITRKMYESEGNAIFDELYYHNFVDTDLFARMLKKKKVVKCFDIAFDHRHPWGVHLADKPEIDEIYRIGQSTYPQDASRFHRKFEGQQINVNFDVEEFQIDEEET